MILANKLHIQYFCPIIIGTEIPGHNHACLDHFLKVVLSKGLFTRMFQKNPIGLVIIKARHGLLFLPPPENAISLAIILILCLAI